MQISNIQLEETRNYQFEDPSSALLYLQLRDAGLARSKGADEISKKTDFDIVLQIGEALCQIGELIVSHF